VLQDLGIVDATIEEPKGGAHRDIDLMASRIQAHLVQQLAVLKDMSTEDMLEQRYQRLLSYGN
jgi:acetyl-CoA carboxylase carboxyl transferase subunit alpha